MENIPQAYTNWLTTYNWDYFFTATFRSPRREPYYALKHVRNELEKHGACRGFLGAEPHVSGDLHIHGIVSGPGGTWKPDIALPWVIEEAFNKRFGRARVQACNSQEAVTGYCAKYVLKGQGHASDHYEIFGDKVWWEANKHL